MRGGEAPKYVVKPKVPASSSTSSAHWSAYAKAFCPRTARLALSRQFDVLIGRWPHRRRLNLQLHRLPQTTVLLSSTVRVQGIILFPSGLASPRVETPLGLGRWKLGMEHPGATGCASIGSPVRTPPIASSLFVVCRLHHIKHVLSRQPLNTVPLYREQSSLQYPPSYRRSKPPRFSLGTWRD